MKFLFCSLKFFLVLSCAVLPLSCGLKGNQEAAVESPSGASFKRGKGITFKEETAKIIGLDIANVTEDTISEVIEINVQVFTEIHRLTELKMDHTGCQFHGSGFLPTEKANLVKPKQAVKFQTSHNQELEGFVIAIQKPLLHGESEIIVGITSAESSLKDGDFLKATISAPQNKQVTIIPSSALLKTVEGTYVYVVNGNAYFRTAVKVGSKMDEKIEITDGLYAGDQVVSKPVETLWLIELRATKGGGHCH